MKRKSNALLAAGTLAFLIGAGLVVGTLRGGSDAAAADHLASTVLVAKDSIPAGMSGEDALKKGLVAVREVPPRDRVAGALTSTTELAGRVLDFAVAPGEQLTTAELRPPAMRASSIKIPEGKQGVAVQLPFVAGGAGYVAAGDRVNVYGNHANVNDDTVTKLVLQNVQVLDVSTEVAPRVAGDEERPTGTTVTYLLALDPNEAEHVIFLAANAQLWLALAGDDAGSLPPTAGRRTADVLQ
jgi:Flp pilus assembly protein CpaB